MRTGDVSNSIPVCRVCKARTGQMDPFEYSQKLFARMPIFPALILVPESPTDATSLSVKLNELTK